MKGLGDVLEGTHPLKQLEAILLDKTSKKNFQELYQSDPYFNEARSFFYDVWKEILQRMEEPYQGLEVNSHLTDFCNSLGLDGEVVREKIKGSLELKDNGELFFSLLAKASLPQETPSIRV